ncbi:MAG: tetratricopeptide repeat protein [Bacteroidota bacterium]
MKLSYCLTLVCWGLGGLWLGLSAQADYYFDRAFRAESAGELSQALVFYSLAIEADPENEIFYIARGDLVSTLPDSGYSVQEKINSTHFRKARADYDRALELQPQSYLAYMSRGTLFYNHYQYDRAKSDFDQACKLARFVDDKIYAQGARGSVKFKLNEVDGALYDLEAALRLDSTNAYLLNEIGYVYLQLERFETARDYYERILQHDPENLVAFANVGYTHLKTGDYSRALSIYNDAIHRHPNRAFLYSNRALIFHRLGLNERALADINHSLGVESANAYARYVRAIIQLAQGESDAACTDLFRARDLGYTLDYGPEVVDLLMEHCIQANQKPQAEEKERAALKGE